MGFVFGANSAFGGEKPHVLLILADDLKPALGCDGDAASISPNIDALAARSIRFDLAGCNQARLCAVAVYVDAGFAFDIDGTLSVGGVEGAGRVCRFRRDRTLRLRSGARERENLSRKHPEVVEWLRRILAQCPEAVSQNPKPAKKPAGSSRFDNCPVGFRTPVAVELPGLADFLDEIQIDVVDQ